MKHLTRISLAAVLLLLSPREDLSAQPVHPLRADTLALLGPVPVTARELRQRLELMPWPGKDIGSRVESTKVHALQGLVAEKLLSLEARRIGLAEDATTRRMRHGLENLFIRDALYRREVVAKVNPTEEEIREGLRRFAKQVTVLALGTSNRDDAQTLSSALMGARSADSVVNALPQRFLTAQDTVVVNFGGPDEAFETAAYRLGKNRISPPVESPVYGWVTLILLRSESNSASAKMTPADRRNRVEKGIKGRKEMIRSGEFYYSLLRDRTVIADSLALLRLTGDVLAIWAEDTAAAKSKGGYAVGPGMIDPLIARLGEAAEKPLVTLDDGPFSLGDAVEMLRYNIVTAQVRDTFPVAIALNEALRDIVAGEILAREGRRQKLQYSPDVQRDMEMWSSYWAARSLFYTVRESVSVSDEDVFSFLVQKASTFGRDYEVNIREVFVPDLASVDSVLQRLQANEPLADVARAMTSRTEWRSRGGESGFFKVAERPELGFRALQAEPKVLQGPVRLAEGYSLFTVLAVRKTNSAAPGYDTLAANVRQHLLNTHRQQRMDLFIATLAKQYRVQFFYDRLDAVPVTATNMFTRRNIGFGGSMLALPLLFQQWEWTRQYRPSADLVP